MKHFDVRLSSVALKRRLARMALASLGLLGALGALPTPAVAAPVGCDFENPVVPACGFDVYGSFGITSTVAFSGSRSLYNNGNGPMGVYFNQLIDADNMMMLAWAGFPAARIDIYGYQGPANALTFVGNQTVIMQPAGNWFRVDLGPVFDAVTYIVFYPSTTVNAFGTFGTFAIDDFNLLPPSGMPAPGTLALFALGLGGFGVARRRLMR